MLFEIAQDYDTAFCSIGVSVFIFDSQDAHSRDGVTTLMADFFEFVLGDGIINIHVIDVGVFFLVR